MDDPRNQEHFRIRDLGEIAVGACVMAFPTATTGEVWDLAQELKLTRVLLFAFASWIFLGFLVYFMHNHGAEKIKRREFIKRILSTYIVTFLICALLLFGIDRLGWTTDPIVALKRTILVTFPASFAATVVDGLR